MIKSLEIIKAINIITHETCPIKITTTIPVILSPKLKVKSKKIKITDFYINIQGLSWVKKVFRRGNKYLLKISNKKNKISNAKSLMN